MNKFKVGQKVKWSYYGTSGEGFYVREREEEEGGYIVERVDGDGWGRDDDIPEDYTPKSTNTYWYVDTIEPIQEPQYTPITPKVGERYRVLREFQGAWAFGWEGKEAVGNIIECEGDFFKPVDFTFSNGRTDNQRIGTFLTTEYLELVEDTPQSYGGGISDEAHEPINKTKQQTIMQKLTSALKRALSADKQTLYKAGLINSGLDLSSEGRNAYVNALFQNDGDHKAAVAEMVADATEMLKEDE